MTPDSRIDAECAAVRSEIFSANTQASVVLAAVAIAMVPLASHAATLFHQHWPITTLAAIGVAALFGAVWLLLGVVLPRLDASGRGSFQTWSRCDRDSLKDALSADYQLDELLVMSRIATAKYVSLRWAGRLLRAALLLLVMATLLSVIH
jgi:hypothetical protein